jgi:hypothetical protein
MEIAFFVTATLKDAQILLEFVMEPPPVKIALDASGYLMSRSASRRVAGCPYCSGVSINTGVVRVASGSISSVPIPATVWLFSSGLLELVGLARRKKAA